MAGIPCRPRGLALVLEKREQIDGHFRQRRLGPRAGRAVEALERERLGAARFADDAGQLRDDLRAALDLDEQPLARRHRGDRLRQRRQPLAFPLGAFPTHRRRAAAVAPACASRREDRRPVVRSGGFIVNDDDTAVARGADVDFARRRPRSSRGAATRAYFPARDDCCPRCAMNSTVCTPQISVPPRRARVRSRARPVDSSWVTFRQWKRYRFVTQIPFQVGGGCLYFTRAHSRPTDVFLPTSSMKRTPHKLSAVLSGSHAKAILRGGTFQPRAGAAAGRPDLHRALRAQLQGHAPEGRDGAHHLHLVEELKEPFARLCKSRRLRPGGPTDISRPSPGGAMEGAVCIVKFQSPHPGLALFWATSPVAYATG